MVTSEGRPTPYWWNSVITSILRSRVQCSNQWTQINPSAVEVNVLIWWTPECAHSSPGFTAGNEGDSRAEQTPSSRETACVPGVEAVISVSCLINPWERRHRAVPAIWPSPPSPAGCPPAPRAPPGARKAVGCPPVERQILQWRLSPWKER